MMISCPSCAAGYDVPGHLLAGAGQALRCARCQHEWVVTLPSPVAAIVAPPVEMRAPEPVLVHAPQPLESGSVPPPAQEAGPAPPPGPGPNVAYPDLAPRLNTHVPIMMEADAPHVHVQPYNRTALAVAWLLTVLVIALMGFGAVYWRGPLMDAWPPSQRAYALIGLR